MQTPISDARAKTKIKRSRFFCLLRSIDDADEAKVVVAEMALAHEQAKHHCWAYVLGLDGKNFHCSDAGEPSGSAGKPILGVLRRNELSNVVAVVTRYFGGIKLGIRGLIDAYAGATELAVDGAKLEELVQRFTWTIRASYADYDRLCHGLSGIGAVLGEGTFSDRVDFDVTVTAAMLEEIEAFIAPFEGAGMIEVKR